MHVYDFITDEFQYELKQKARKKHTRFEEVLRTYRILFFKSLDQCTSRQAAKGLPKALREDKAVAEQLQALHEMVHSERPVAEQLFDEVINGYILFLHGKHFLATLNYQDLLENHSLLVEENPDKLGLLFRGTDMKGDNVAKFYHIPYDTRHKVKNQRFSFSGIPFLYLGASVADIFFEFSQPDLNAREPYVASFATNPAVPFNLSRRYAPDGTRTKIYNITNRLFNQVNENIRLLTRASEKNSINPVSRPGTTLRIYFRIAILAQFCTFPRLEESSPFCEEYVIPQLFTEALRMHKYDGIVFSSTEFSQQQITFDTPFPNLRFKDNMVWFTEYSENSLYDEKLLSNFEITVKTLQGYGAVDSVSLQATIQAQAHALIQQLHSYPESCERTRLKDSLTDICDRMGLYRGMKINQQPYLDTSAGKLELVYTQNYLDFLQTQVSATNP